MWFPFVCFLWSFWKLISAFLFNITQSTHLLNVSGRLLMSYLNPVVLGASSSCVIEGNARWHIHCTVSLLKFCMWQSPTSHLPHHLHWNVDRVLRTFHDPLLIALTFNELPTFLQVHFSCVIPNLSCGCTKQQEELTIDHKRKLQAFKYCMMHWSLTSHGVTDQC